jgi:hypothetical protein
VSRQGASIQFERLTLSRTLREAIERQFERERRLRTRTAGRG